MKNNESTAPPCARPTDAAVPTNAEHIAAPPKEKVTFDPAQQRRVNELIREAQGRASKDVRALLAAAQQELEDMQYRLVLSRRTLMRQTLGESQTSERSAR